MESYLVINSKNNIEKGGNLFSRILKSAAGRLSLAQSMTAPLRTRIDYVGISRKVFLVEQLPSGALPVYDTSSSKKEEE
jgi:hypothetical protein